MKDMLLGYLFVKLIKMLPILLIAGAGYYMVTHSLERLGDDKGVQSSSIASSIPFIDKKESFSVKSSSSNSGILMSVVVKDGEKKLVMKKGRTVLIFDGSNYSVTKGWYTENMFNKHQILQAQKQADDAKFRLAQTRLNIRYGA